MLIQSLSCAFRLQAGQVTQHDKSDMHGQVTHAFILRFIAQDVLSLVFLLEGLFSFPTHSLSLVSLLYYRHKCVFGQVSIPTSDRCSLSIGQVS